MATMKVMRWLLVNALLFAFNAHPPQFVQLAFPDISWTLLHLFVIHVHTTATPAQAMEAVWAALIVTIENSTIQDVFQCQAISRATNQSAENVHPTVSAAFPQAFVSSVTMISFTNYQAHGPNADHHAPRPISKILMPVLANYAPTTAIHALSSTNAPAAMMIIIIVSWTAKLRDVSPKKDITKPIKPRLPHVLPCAPSATLKRTVQLAKITIS